jgi:hypothetical protein
VQSNAAQAADTNALTTAATFTRLGRLTGYQLDYLDPAAGAVARGKGLVEVASEVELYRSSRAAIAGLAFRRRDDGDVAALRSSMLEITSSRFSPPRVGQGAYGVNSVDRPSGIGTLYESEVTFRHGALIGSVEITSAGRAGAQALAAKLAGKLDARIAAALAGKMHGVPVPLPKRPKAGRAPNGPDLSKLTVGPTDLGSGKVVQQGYEVDNDLMPVSEFVRQMSPAGTFAFIETEVALFATEGQAKFTAALLIDTLASKQALREALGTNFGGVRVTKLTPTPVRLGGSAAPNGLLVKLNLANGAQFTAAFAAVSSGRKMEFLTVFAGVGQELGTGSLQNLFRIASGRLAGHKPHGSVA